MKNKAYDDFAFVVILLLVAKCFYNAYKNGGV
jgi:hypothetical protein